MEPLSTRQIQTQARKGATDATIHVQVTKNQEKTGKNGKPFHVVTLADAEGELTLRIFEDKQPYQAVRQLPAPGFYAITGRWEASRFGLECDRWQHRPLEPAETELLFSGSATLREKQAADYATIESLVGGMSDPRLKALCQAFLEEHGQRFRRTAAAREYHHARRGGLVEHVAQMMRSGAKLAEVYTSTNRDLVLAGVLFHDCGKLWENAYPETGFKVPHKKIGELLGHITLGIEVVNTLWRQLEDKGLLSDWNELKPPSQDVRLHLIHLIASHHGTHEFGSPVLPKTPEATLLHFIDNIDAKMEMVLEGYDRGEELAPGIVSRVRPLRHSILAPLPSFEDEGARAEQPPLAPSTGEDGEEGSLQERVREPLEPLPPDPGFAVPVPEPPASEGPI
ncbi:MAG: HD domain-containing protein [Verrucomicrobiota bacterium]